MAGGGIPPVGRDRALSEGDAAPAGAYGQCHTSAELLSLSRQLALCQLPVKTCHQQLFTAMGIALATPIFFL